MSAFSNLLIPAVLFFALGLIARAIKSDLRMPPDLAKVLSIYLLMAIGLHGGYELGKAEISAAFNAVLWAIVLGFMLPLIGYALLMLTRRVDHMNAAAIAAHYAVSVVAAPIEPEAVNAQIVDLRSRLRVKTILRNRPGAAKELIRVFRENRTLGILIDQDTEVEGTFVEFFGRKAWTPTAAAQMAIKFHAPVLFGYIHRGPDDRHRIVIEGPIELIRTGDHGEDIKINTARFTTMIEQAIRMHPEQWVWMHRRWRRQP